MLLDLESTSCFGILFGRLLYGQRLLSNSLLIGETHDRCRRLKLMSSVKAALSNRSGVANIILELMVHLFVKTVNLDSFLRCLLIALPSEAKYSRPIEQSWSLLAVDLALSFAINSRRVILSSDLIMDVWTSRVVDHDGCINVTNTVVERLVRRWAQRCQMRDNRSSPL
jgi:hypothetical protein